MNGPRRILHVVGKMDRAGTETWLMQILRRIDRKAFHMDFLVQVPEPGHFDEEIRDLGSKVILCGQHKRPWAFARRFKAALERHGPYDIVHSHVDHYTGFIMWLSRRFHVPRRIAHCHNDTSLLQKRAGPARRFYFRLMNRWIADHATDGLAASRKAAAAMFGPDWERQQRCRVLHCGIDLMPFLMRPDREQIRAQLGLPPDARIVGHVGRFEEQKNHTFFVDIAAELVRINRKVHFLLVGDGSLRRPIREKVERLGLSRHFTMTGVRADIPELLHAMDVFLFPSIFEGLGLALIEAQAAGLPCVISSLIPGEVDVVQDLVWRLGVDKPASDWAEIISRAVPSIAPNQVDDHFEKSPFAIDRGLLQLETIYS